MFFGLPQCSDLHISLLDCPPRVHKNVHHLLPTFEIMKTSENLAFFFFFFPMATVLKLERNCPDLDLNLLDQSKNAGNISIFHLEG